MEDYSKIDLGLLYANHYEVVMTSKNCRECCDGIFYKGPKYYGAKIEMDISFRKKKPHVVYKVRWNDYDDNNKYISLQKSFGTLEEAKEYFDKL